MQDRGPRLHSAVWGPHPGLLCAAGTLLHHRYAEARVRWEERHILDRNLQKQVWCFAVLPSDRPTACLLRTCRWQGQQHIQRGRRCVLRQECCHCHWRVSVNKSLWAATAGWATCHLAGCMGKTERKTTLGRGLREPGGASAWEGGARSHPLLPAAHRPAPPAYAASSTQICSL